MKTIAFLIAVMLASSGICLADIDDPVDDYLQHMVKESRRIEFIFYASDEVYRYDVDLDNDGTKEVLVSSSLERDGKQGYEFYVYKKTRKGYRFFNKIMLHKEGFYLGKIPKLHCYGAVHYWPSGPHGILIVYVIEGEKIVEKTIGTGRNSSVWYDDRSDPHYVPAAATISHEVLATKYKIPIDPRTYEQAFHERLKKERGE